MRSPTNSSQASGPRRPATLALLGPRRGGRPAALADRSPDLTELLLARAGSTAAGPGTLTRFVDRLVATSLDRAVAHLAWHALLTVVVGTVAQEGARGADRVATFQAVLDITMTGLLAAARHPRHLTGRPAGRPPTARLTARHHHLEFIGRHLHFADANLAIGGSLPGTAPAGEAGVWWSAADERLSPDPRVRILGV